GNAFILKPSERDPSASNIVARLSEEAGLPSGVLQVLHTGTTVFDALREHDAVAAVSVVGSTPIAKHVHATASAAGKRVQALGGANNHAVVMPDANIEFAATQVASGAFGSAGERCMAVPVAVTVGDAHEEFMAAIRAEAEKLVVGPGAAPRTARPPVIPPDARERVIRMTDEAEAAGATIVVDGRGLVVGGQVGDHDRANEVAVLVALDHQAATVHHDGGAGGLGLVGHADHALAGVRGDHRRHVGARVIARAHHQLLGLGPDPGH